MRDALLTCTLIPVMLLACIEDPAPSADPNLDTDAMPQADAMVDAAPDALIDASVPCKVDVICPPDTVEVEFCPDQTCSTFEACGKEIVCHPCMPGPQQACPEGTQRDSACPDDVDCVEWTDGCGRVDLCVPLCPPHTTWVEACLEGDPACWTLDNGAACMSAGCRPVPPQAVCLERVPSDTCQGDPAGCETRVLCGYEADCVVGPRDCDDGPMNCEPGWRRSDTCAPDGQACTVHPNCNGLYFCVACRPDEDCP